MIAELTEEAISTIKNIVNHGNKAVVQRTGKGVIVMEEKRQIKYTTPPEVAGR